MYNFDEHNRAVSRYNNSREVSRPDTDRKPYFDRYEYERHNREVDRYHNNREVKRYCIDD